MYSSVARSLAPRCPVFAPALRALTFCCLLFSLAPSAALAADEDEARSFVGSVAETIFAVAWPTATYEGVKIHRVDSLSNGLDIQIRLFGESAFGGELLLDLLMVIRDGGLQDLQVKDHNAMLVPPFKTAEAFGQMIQDMAAEYNQQSAPAPSASLQPSPFPSSTSQKVAAVCISNPTPHQLGFRYRWGNGQWTTSSLDPEYHRTFYWTYESGTQTSPKFYIAFDNNFTSGVTETNYWLERYAATLPVTCDAAKTHKFVVNGQAIDLKVVD